MSKYVKDFSIYSNFRKEEFKCKCGKCNGYGDGIAKSLVETMQNLRNKYNKAINISSGYRCYDHNKKVGGSQNSKHLKGQACDFYFQDGSLGNQNFRIKIVEELKKTKYYDYAYCNIDGNHPNMGSAIHLATSLVDIEDEKDDSIVSIDIDSNVIIGNNNIINENEDEKEVSENNSKKSFFKVIGDFFLNIFKKIVKFILKG